MNFSNYKVSTRLALGYGFIILFLLAIAATGINAVENSNAALRKIVEVNVAKIELTEKMAKAIDKVTRVMRTIALLKDETELSKEKNKITTARSDYDESLGKLEQLPLTDDGKTILARVKEETMEGRRTNNEFMAMLKTDHDGAVTYLLNASIPTVAKWQDSLNEFIELQKRYDKEDQQTAFDSNQKAITFIIIFSFIALVLSIAIGWLITRSIRNQLGGEPAEATKVALQIADGDLTADVNISDNDHSSMMFAIKKMRDNLLSIVNDVRHGTDTIALASGEIAAGNLDLSSRTEQQAASLEETASSMEELTATVKQNADNSRQANKLATSASEVAVKGGTVVAQVVNTMEEINTSAKKIVDIIGVIDGIAFQTNILALNAAVEAARAGEQGRGFAVVASEVRNLAQRSAAAAKEIKGLINDSVEKVDTGSKLVSQAGTTMEEVVASVKRVNDIINEITEASNEQAAGIDQINQAITQMDEVTQQNAALVEEAAAAAGSLQEQANNLVEVVRVFKTEKDTAIAVVSAKLVTATVRKTGQVVKMAPVARVAGRVATTKPLSPKIAAAGGGSWEEF